VPACADLAMWKTIIFFTIIIPKLSILACNLSISDVFGNSGEPDVNGTEVQASKKVTAT
jgi:hypothetical protein